MQGTEGDFDSFYLHFLESHTRSITRWMHVAAVSAGVIGAATALATLRPLPALLGGAAAAALAAGAHPLFEGNTPQNAAHPLWAARAVFRMCARQITGAIEEDLAAMNRAEVA